MSDFMIAVVTNAGVAVVAIIAIAMVALSRH